MLGWSPQYLHNMLNGDSFGIQPVTALLKKFPELNARWLILGEGVMIQQDLSDERPSNTNSLLSSDDEWELEYSLLPDSILRYRRLAAERIARSNGYDPKRLRSGRQRGNLTIFPIIGEEEAGECTAVVVDETLNATLKRWAIDPRTQ